MNKKIKIAYVAKNLKVNGITTVIINYCSKINKSIFEITVFAGSPVDEKSKEKLNSYGIDVVQLPPKNKNHVLSYYALLWKNLKNKNFDIIHIHGNSSTITVELLIAKLLKIKNRIAHCHNTTCNNIKIHKFLQPFFEKLYTYGLACSNDAGKWMFGNNKFHVLPNGFNTKKFQFNVDNRNRIRKKLNIENLFVIGHVGRFNNQKNHPFILKVFEDIAKKMDNVCLLLVGSGPDYDKIQKLIEVHPYRSRIICYGETDKVNEVYDAMDLFLFPSKFEGLGIVLLEAQMKGLPCVASDVIPNEVILNKNMVKFLSLEDNIDKWTKSIKEYNKVYCRNEFFSNNFEKINKYDINNNVLDIEKIYSNLK